MRMPSSLLALALLATVLTAQEHGEGAPEAPPKPEPGSPQWALEALAPIEGLEKRLFAAEPLVKDPVAFCIDEQGRVYVAESFRQEHGVEDNRSSSWWLMDDLAAQTVEDRLAMYEKWAHKRKTGMAYYSEGDDQVRRITDTDGDGVGDRVEDFALGFNDPLDGTGAGLIARDGVIYYTNIPHLWRLEDRDEDGVAEIREAESSGYGVRIALRGHDMHGLVWGWDGRLYWSIGDRGYHLTTREGVLLHSPGEGAVFRMEEDGSNLEVFCHGLRNPQELAFDRFGNLFTGDNNSDGGDRARLVHCVEGGETGWHMAYQTLGGDNRRGPWMGEGIWKPRHDEQPLWIMPPIANLASGPSGLAYYPGLGLPPRYHDHFFLCDFRGSTGGSRVLSFAAEPRGAGFELVDEHPFASRVLCTDVDFGYDGRVYISDWGKGWVHNGQGRIYTVFDPERVNDPLVQEVSTLFAEGFAERSAGELVELLAHPDWRVRQRAQFTFVDRALDPPEPMDIPLLPEGMQLDPSATEQLAKVARNDEADTMARIHAVWGLGTIARRTRAMEGDEAKETMREAGRALQGLGKVLVAAATLPEQSEAILEPAGFEEGDPAVGEAVLAEELRLREELRTQIARVYGDAGFAPGAPLLLKVLEAGEDNARLTYHATMALGKLGVVEAVEPILAMVRANDDEDIHLRHAAVMALTWLDATDRMAALAVDESAAVRTVAVLVLRRHADPRIAGFLYDLDPRLVTEAARAIHDLPIDSALSMLAPMIHRYTPTAEVDEPVAAHVFQVEVFRKAGEHAGDLASHPAFTRAADERAVRRSAEGFRDHGDDYCSRLSGVVTAPASGSYTFHLCSDDESVLFLSRDATPAGKEQVAAVQGWANPGEWERYPEQTSAPIELEAGQQIYLEALHREGAGGDHLAIGWTLPDGTKERPIGAAPATRDAEIPLMRRILSAVFRRGGVDGGMSLLDFARNPENPEVMRREALAALLDWKEPGPRDRVLGTYRPVDREGRDAEALGARLAEVLPTLIASTEGVLVPQLLELTEVFDVPLSDDALAAVVRSRFQPAKARLAALRRLIAAPVVAEGEEAKLPELSAAAESALEAALASEAPELRADARAFRAKQREAGAAIESLGKLLAEGTVDDQRRAVRALVTAGGEPADDILLAALESLQSGELAPEVHLDLLDALGTSDSERLKAALAAYEATLPAEDPLARFRVTLHGGDAERGKRIFSTHLVAQCTRCHKAAGEGGVVGPDLTAVAARLSPEEILESLIVPQAKVAEGFGEFSAMPPAGLLLSRQELRDVQAFLQTLR